MSLRFRSLRIGREFVGEVLVAEPKNASQKWELGVANLTLFYQRVLRDSKANRSSVHGPCHWARVERNGLYLSEFTMADPAIIRLFAVLHDSRRTNDSCDPAHGERAAEYAATLRADVIDLNDEDFAILDYAIRWHTDGNEVINETVAVCWDADRLDLNRVGIRPQPEQLFSDEAKRIAAESDYGCLNSYQPNGLASHKWAH